MGLNKFQGKTTSGRSQKSVTTFYYVDGDDQVFVNFGFLCLGMSGSRRLLYSQ